MTQATPPTANSVKTQRIALGIALSTMLLIATYGSNRESPAWIGLDVGDGDGVDAGAPCPPLPARNHP